MKAEWIVEYDLQTDSTYLCPGCVKCYAPVFKMTDGKYRCVSCRERAELDDEMKAFLEERAETKVEMEDCTKFEWDDKQGHHSTGCGGKGCVEVHYCRNPVTMEWQTAFGECTVCGSRFIV